MSVLSFPKNVDKERRHNIGRRKVDREEKSKADKLLFRFEGICALPDPDKIKCEIEIFRLDVRDYLKSKNDCI